MDFVKTHSPSEEYTTSHEQYRGFVMFHRTQAAAALAIEKDDPEGAIDAIHDGLEYLRVFFEEHNLEERLDEDGMVQQLKKIQQQVRELHGIEATLKEKLAEAVKNEEYEAAARLRDALKKREK
jgi:hypothetical protein